MPKSLSFEDSGTMVEAIWRNGVAMAMNIKNDETQRLARELAEMTDESLTAAVTEALRERLERVRKARGAGLASRLVRIGKECAAQLQEPYRSADHGDLLYDDRGLPR